MCCVEIVLFYALILLFKVIHKDPVCFSLHIFLLSLFFKSSFAYLLFRLSILLLLLLTFSQFFLNWTLIFNVVQCHEESLLCAKSCL